MAKNKGKKSLFPDEPNANSHGPVECLGMTFLNDEERRGHFLNILREKLKDREFRKIEGFPIGSDEDILALSDPPYYTACPNPFITDFIKHYGKPYDPGKPYSREPFAVDVSEGKTDPIYKAHSYHTKVPHLAIVPSILHYTEPGDVALDGFCGSGMTGVAALWCGSAQDTYRRQVEADFANQGMAKPEWGARRVVLNDLSPAATFIAANYNMPFDVHEFVKAAKQILLETEREIGWMYRTVHSSTKDAQRHEGEILKVLLGETPCPSWVNLGRIEYTVWSEVFTCPDCAGEVVFLDEALDEETKRVRDTFPCPHCGANLTKESLQRVFETQPDSANRKPWKRVKYRPSLIVYAAGGKRCEKQPDAFDLAILDRIGSMPLPAEIPTNRFPIEQMYHGSRIEPKGFTNIHHFFLPARPIPWRRFGARQTIAPTPAPGTCCCSALSKLFGECRCLIGTDRYTSPKSTAICPGSTMSPHSMLNAARGTFWTVSWNVSRRHFKSAWQCQTSPSSTPGPRHAWDCPISLFDYVFSDPPFGENIYYADLNFLVESWHRVATNTASEAIVDKFKNKGLPEYQHLMQRCFQEYCRVLKPGRWMTVVFHNSRNAVWNAIQEAMQAAGFVVADVRTLDKQQGSYRQVTSTAVKQDLVISAYKPNGGLDERFRLTAGTEEGAWDFVRTHLRHLPVFVSKGGKAEAIGERQSYLLFDRMVAFHVQRGVTVPISAAEFYGGLTQRFSERDGMYFLPEQVAEYDQKRLTVKEILQLELFVSDEASAIQWLKQQLTKKPQTFQELHPQFLKEIGGWSKNEVPLELSTLLEQNFLRYDGSGEVPSQIHSYLSTNFKELRNLRKDAPDLRVKGKDRWYVPDPSKAGDLEKLRERALLREFGEYLPPGYKPVKPESLEGFIPGLEPKPLPVPKGKKIKVIRLEAVRAGFKLCWQNRDYRTIIAVAQRIPENVLEEDPKLLMWYDQAMTRSGEE